MNAFLLIEDDETKLKNEVIPKLEECVDFPARVGPDTRSEEA